MKYKSKRVTIPELLVHGIVEFMEKDTDYNFQSVGHFVRDTVFNRLKQLHEVQPPALMVHWSGSASDFILRIMESMTRFTGPLIKKDHLLFQVTTQGMTFKLVEETIEKLLSEGILYMPKKGFLRGPDLSTDSQGSILDLVSPKDLDVKPEVSPEYAAPYEMAIELIEVFGNPGFVINKSGILIVIWYEFRLAFVSMPGLQGLVNIDPFELDCPPFLISTLRDVVVRMSKRTEKYADEWKSLIKQLKKEQHEKRTDLI